MIKILHVVSSLNINSGVMSVLMNYYRHIDRLKIQFDFLYFEDIAQNHQKEISKLGGNTYYLSYPTFRLADQKKLRDFFSKHQGDYLAVHCHPIWAAEVVAREAKKIGIKHIIQHSHSTKYAETKKSEIRNRLLLKFIGFFATDFMACSPEAAYLFGETRVNEGRVFILPNAITTEMYRFDKKLRSNLRNEFKVSDDTLLVGNIGRLSPQKNQIFCLNVFSKIHKKNPNSCMLIVGEGALRVVIEKKIDALGLRDCVFMTGKRSDIQAILSGLDLFLMPSKFEGAPVAAIEALTSGLPCVVSDVITKSIMMEGVKYISLSLDPDEWANCCLRFYQESNTRDREDITNIISHGFDIRKAAKLLENYYFDLR